MPLIGIHAPVQGATTAFKQICLNLDAEVVTWMMAEGPQDVAEGVTNLVRLPSAIMGTSADAYAAMVRPTIARWRAANALALFIPGNETDLPLEGSWTRNGWERAFPAYVAALRKEWPSIQIACPAFSVGNMSWMSKALTDPCDAVCAHCYFPMGVRDAITDLRFGGAWQFAMHFGKPVWITECNSNPTNPSLIAAWIKTLPPSVAGLTLFIADGAMTWPPYNITPLQATMIRAALPAHSITEPITGHTIKGAFLDYYRAQGETAILGLPISERLASTLPADNGRLVQYFERARLEWWPEEPDPNWRVKCTSWSAMVAQRIGLTGPGITGVRDIIPNR